MEPNHMSHPPPQGYYPPPPQQGYNPNPQYPPPPQQGYNPNQQYLSPQQQQQQQQWGPPPPQQYPPPPQQQQWGPPPPHQQQHQQHPGDVLSRVFGPNQKLLVEQKVELAEVLIGIETENKYSVTMENGLKVVALEESGFFARMCLGAQRPFQMHVVFKDTNQAFLKFKRPYKFFFSEILVYDPTKGGEGELLGKVAQRFTLCTREFSVRNPQGKELYHITGDCCSTFVASMCPGFAQPSFQIIDPKSQQTVGEIKKKWSGFIKEFYTKADNFGVQFPPSATPAEKALLFAATFLIDYLYFEENTNNNNDRNSN